MTEYAEENLYLDKPIEGAFPLFDVIKLIMDLFGGIEYKQNKAHKYIANKSGNQILTNECNKINLSK